MNQINRVLVFSDNRDTKSIYQSYANMTDSTIFFKDKNKLSLQTLMEQTYDLYIIEIMQPVMSEIEFVDQVYAIVKPHPIVVISSYFYDTKDIVFGEKVHDFILKPFDLDKLLDACKSKDEPAAEHIQEFEQVVAKKVDKVLYESKKLSVLLEISKSLNSITDFDELLHTIIVLAADALNAERATLFLLDRKKKQLWSRSGIGIEKQEIRIPMDTGIAGEVVLSGVAQIIDDPYANPKFNRDVDIKTGFKTRNMLCLPMHNIEGTTLGVFQILNKKDSNFSNEDLQFLGAMAVNTGIAIENAMLHDEMKKQLQEVKQSYDELYIAQKQILKEARFVTFSEVGGYIEHIMKESTVISENLKELKKQYAFDVQIKKTVEKVQESFISFTTKITAFLDEKKSEYYK